MGKKQTLTNGPEGELIDRERANRAASGENPDYGPLGVDQNAIPREGGGYQPERMDLRPVNNPVQPGSPNGVPDLASGQQRAGTPGYQLDPNYSPHTMRSGSGFKMRQTGWLGDGRLNEGVASGGDYIGAVTAAIPTFEIDRQLSDVRKQKAALADWITKQGEQFQGKAADPYQPAYEQYVGNEHNKFIKDVADTYFGGNIDKAWKGVHDDPELRSQFNRLNRYMGAIGQANKSGYAVYEQAMKDIRDGKLELPPKYMELLNDALDGKWAFNGDSPAHSAWKFDQLNDVLSLGKKWNDYFKENVVNAGDKTTGNNHTYKDPKSGRWFLVTDSTEEYNQLVDQFTKQAMKDGPWRNEGDVRDFAESMVGRMSKEEWKELHVGKSGGGSGSNTTEKGYQAKYNYGPTNVSPPEHYKHVSGASPAAALRTAVDQVVLADVTSDKGKFSAPRQFADGTYMHPVSIFEDADGKRFIYGKKGRPPGTTSPKSEKRDSDADFLESGDEHPTTKEFNQLEDAVLPYEGNEGYVESYFPQLTNERITGIIAEGRKKRGGAQPKKAKPLAKGSLDDI